MAALGLPLLLQPGGFDVMKRRGEWLVVVDASRIARAMVDRVDHWLKVEEDVRIGLRQRYGNRWRRDLEVHRPNPAEVVFLCPGHQYCVRAVGPRIEHRHALAAAQQVNLHEARISQQQALPLAQVKVPTRRVRALVGRREDLDTRYQPLLGRGFVDFDEGLAMLFLDEGRASGPVRPGGAVPRRRSRLFSLRSSCAVESSR